MPQAIHPQGDTPLDSPETLKIDFVPFVTMPSDHTVTGQLYLSRIANLAPEVLKCLLDGDELTRDAITKIEQKVQDFLRAVLLPFVGQWDIPDYILKESRIAFEALWSLAEEVRNKEAVINFIGAHYRSRLSVRGRRSAFASRPAIFDSTIKQSLGQKLRGKLGTLLEMSIFQQVWDAVYLEQYFRLFDVNATFSEWALQRQRLKPVAILTTRRKNCAVTTRTMAEHIEVCTVEISKTLTRELWDSRATKLLWQAVAKAIVQTYVEEGAAFQKLEEQSDEAPDTQATQNWLRLIHRANTLATQALEKIGLRSQLAERAAYVKGLLLYRKEYQSFRSALLKEFWMEDYENHRSRITEPNISRIGKFVSVLQSLRFYQDCYGDGCITIPQGLETSTRRSSAPRVGSGARRNPGSKCSVTLFWSSAENFPLFLPTIIGGTPSLLSHALNEAEKRIIQEAPIKGIEPRSLWGLAYRLQGEAKSFLGASAIAKILAVTEDLSRCLHEGKPRAFTFLLGSPQWLISDILIEHELVGSIRPFRLTSRSEQPAIYESTLALLEGNSSFLQSEDLALFVAWPGEPLEVTHIVRLPRLAASRRKLLCQFTAERSGLLAVVTHGNGRGEAIHEGRVRGILRGGRSWKVEPPNYEDFEIQVLQRLLAVVAKGKEDAIRNVLQPAIRDLSEDPGVGALFVIAKSDAIQRLLKASSKLTDVLDSVDGQRLHEMSPEILYQLARDDGAVLICADTLRVWGRRHVLTSALPDLEKSWETPGELEWEHWYKTKKWGTRRRTGLAVSHELQEKGIVIVISADGPVDVLLGGRGVVEYSE
jgi:hypothetical protein